METTGCVKDSFYEDKYKKLNETLYVGDDKHFGGNGLADMLLERLFDETLEGESVLRRIGQKYDYMCQLIKESGIFPLTINEKTDFSKTHYILIDKSNRLRIGRWDKEKKQFFEVKGDKPIENNTIKAFMPNASAFSCNYFGVDLFDLLYNK